ncbi:HYR domain-containing protein [Aequorivita sp. CIP111184]|uniref:HYR domain-containing protein n=1 Tax=Aequorivita sp. CIP111184 TaxID=2211356 RepID=UPI000DBBF1C6|nr:HYR domain-containing protein [Aequorivita sp. CIP111184]SRX52437.1 hypothetical protein AEQU1_00301 [Aequorivita sp. CIP111184]
MKKITLLILLLFATFISNSQTALTAGDIAFIGSNTDYALSADDNVTFVLLKDIDAATTIIFTDMGWNDGTGFFATNGDGEFTWTSGLARSAGDVVTINMAPLAPASYSSIGDQIFAIQGSTATPVFIAGMQSNDITAGGDDANWDGVANSNSTSALPNALVTGTTAVRLVPEADNWQFSCVLAGGAVVGTAADIRAIVNNRANWVSDNTTVYNPAVESGCTFTVTTGGDTTPPEIFCAPTPAPIIAGIDGMAAIPDLVSGTMATDDVSDPVNITITQSPTAGTMAGVGVNSVVLTATDEAGNTATCTIPVTINEPPSTVLAAGDIAFVGFNLDDTDSFAFIILKDIIAGTNIKLTDCGVSNPNTITCASSGGDGSATWYAPSAMSAGDIVTLPGSFMSGSVLSSIGDQLFAYQGTAASPSFIAAIHNNVDPGGTTDADWDGANTSNQTTALPDQLTNGVNAIRLYVAGTPETEVDNWQFDCSSVPGGVPITGTAAQIAAIINDIQYWINNDNTEFVPTANSGCGYSVILTSFTAPADLCIDAGVQTSLGGGTPTGGVYSGPGVTDDGNGATYSFDPATAGVGIHTLTYTESGNSVTDDIEVFALDDASFSYSAASYCSNAADPTPTISGLVGGTFTSGAGLSINAATGVIDVSASTPGTYTVTYTTSGTCSNSSSVNVTINAADDASFSYGAASYCANATDPTPTISGLAGGTFTSVAGLSINASTGAIDVSASTPGTYTVTYTTAGTCPNSSGVSVTINALDDASFSYSAASYCVSAADPTPTITGLAGGIFTSSPAGLSINASTGVIDVSASTPSTYTVTYTTSGTCPNSSSVSVSINALDNASFSYGAASYCIAAADPTPTITGLAGGTFSSGAGLSINAATGTIDLSASTPGSYTITYTTSGTCPNSSSVSVTINALDDASFNYSAAAYCADAADPTPTITGVVGGTFTSGAGLSINASTGTIDVSASTPGTYTITYTTTGACSNSSNVSVAINALDDASFSYNASAYCVDGADPTPTITGLSGGIFTSGAGLSINAATGTIDVSASIPGAYTVTYTTSGTCPNNSGVSVTINTLPIVTFSAPTSPVCPSAILTGQGGGSPVGGVYSGPGVTDDGNGMTYAFDAGVAGNGTHTLTYTFSEANGCTNSASDSVTVEDTEPPVANCAAPFTIQLDVNGMASILLADIENGSTDNCGVASTSIDITDFDCSNLGPNTVTLTVTDVNGNSSTCTTIVTVEDNVPPVANCAAPFTIQLDANGMVSITVADIDNGSTDACGIASTTIDITNFTCADVGPNSVTLTVTDVNGNVSTCTTIVTVQDSIPPTIACPADISVNTDAGNCSAIVNFSTPIAFDNCGVDTILQTMGDSSGSMFPVGTTTIEFTATDVNGNSSTCSFTITVIDNEAPVAVCQNITIQLDAAGNASIVAADVDGGSTDQCGVANISIDIDTFDCSDIGDNNVILTVTDVNGNTNTCTAIVTVEDVTAPVVVCQNITVELDPVTGTITILGTDIDNGSTDACGIASYDLDIDTFDCSNIGDNTIVLTVTDVNGNTETCTAIVTVEDNTNPILVCQDFTIEIGADGTATLDPSDVITSNDDACGILTVAVDITQFSCADIGTPVTVQIFSQDNNGNLATCTATVTAVDLLAPVVTCPADQTVDPGQGNLFYIVPDYFATGEATAIDNCTDPLTVFTQDPAPGTTLSDGTYTITLTATDAYGNIGTCTFELTVESILGVGDTDQNLGTITMYPVPTKDILNIGNPQSIDLERLEIYDLRGRLVMTADLRGMGTLKSIDVHQLAASSYYVKFIGKEGQITKRLLKE